MMTIVDDIAGCLKWSSLSECAVKLRRLRRKYQARTAKQSNQC
ncbi:hypothetical protein [Kingella negevensis]|nr:hypothetical protein [Kingella negevensis]